MRLKLIGILLLMLPFICSCNDDDDIEGIFLNRIWYVTEVFNSAGTPALEDSQRSEIRNNQSRYYISFTQSSFMGVAGSNQFSGSWTVNGSNHSIRFYNISQGTSNTISSHIIQILENAERYEGDYNQLRIYTSDEASILFNPGSN